MELSGCGDTTTPMSGSGGLQYPLYGEEENWPPGYELFDGYHVVKLLGRGGMGAVYLVERRLSGGRVQFAVKTLIPSLTQNESYRRRFLRELRTWIDLPAHPNIARCYFFRTVDRRLAIFSEYVDAGSLEEWIRKRKLNDVEKILDILIQVARALSCAHECGVVHQDIKPSNIMLNQNGIVKLVDFGLAKSRFSRRAQEVVTESGRTVLISSSGWTLAYCSPEQLEAKPISRKTDIWSFGVSVLEIFNGGVTWRYGASADIEFKRYLEWCGRVRARVPVMPDPLVRIVDRCLQSKPEQRWRSAADLADALIQAYRDIVGQYYDRDKPRFYPVRKRPSEEFERRTFGGANWKNPRVFLEKVVDIIGIDKSEVRYPDEDTMTSRKSQALLDLEVFNTAEMLLESYLDQFKDKDASYLMAAMLLEKSIVLSECGDLTGERDVLEKAKTYIKNHRDLKSRDCYSRCVYNSAIVYQYLGETEKAFKLFDEAVRLYQMLSEETNDPDFTIKWSNALMNKAITLDKYGFFEESMKVAYKATHILEKTKDKYALDKLDLELAFGYLYLASFVQKNGDINEAIGYLKKGIQYYEDLFYREVSYDSAYSLAMAYNNMSLALKDLWKLDEAYIWLDRSERFCQMQIESWDMTYLRSLLGDIYYQKAMIHFKRREWRDVKLFLDKSLDIFYEMVERQGVNQSRGEYARGLLIKNLVLCYRKEISFDGPEMEHAIEYWKYLMKNYGDLTFYVYFLGGLIGWGSRYETEIFNPEWSSWMDMVYEVVKRIGNKEVEAHFKKDIEKYLSEIS